MIKLYKLTVTLLLTTLTTFQIGLFSQNVNIPDANFKAVLVANSAINTNLDTEIQVSEANAYSGTISAATQGIADLTGIQAFISLTGLDVSHNSLTSIDLFYNSALTTLNCSYNSLACLDVSNNTALTSLNCTNNSLSSLNLKNGNNAILTTMSAMGAGGMLYCIQVDNVAAAVSAPGWSEDTWSTYTLTCGTVATASFTSNAPVCFGFPVTFSNTSTNSSDWHWDFGDGNTSTLQNPTHTYATGGIFPVTLNAKNCYSHDTASANIIESTNIYGSASYSLGPVTSGIAILYPSQPFYISFDTLQIQPLDASGNFTFTHVPQGNYLIQVYPDTLAFPTLIPTYSTSFWVWDSAFVFSQNCVTDGSVFVTMRELTPSTPGIGLIHGHVLEGQGFGRAQGDPVHGVAVKRGITGTSQIVGTTFTDINGQFTFGNIEFGTYTIYVDIPGLLRDSVYTITVDAANNQYTNLYYGVDSAKVYIIEDIGIEDIQSENPNHLNVFPNPSKEHTTIQYTLSTQANVQLAIYNIYGTKVHTLVNNTYLQNGEYTYELNTRQIGLKPGVYFVTLSVNGKSKTMRIVLME